MWFGCSEKAVIINHRKRSVLCQGIEVQGFWNPETESHGILIVFYDVHVSFLVAKHLKQIARPCKIYEDLYSSFPNSSFFKYY